MPNKPLYGFDANAIISALMLPGSTPRHAFDKACAQGRLLLSEPILNELDDVLRRPRLEKYIREDERIHFMVALLREARIFQVTETVADCRDPQRRQVSCAGS